MFKKTLINYSIIISQLFLLAILENSFINEDIFNEINEQYACVTTGSGGKKKITWKAASPKSNPLSKFNDAQIRRICGTRINQQQFRLHKSERQQQLAQYFDIKLGFESYDDTLPESFDARVDWGECIHPVREQGDCGSCWALTSAEMLEDRVCVQSYGYINTQLSPNYMLSCDLNNFGCDGGYIDYAFWFLEDYGLVTEFCDPYSAGYYGFANECPASCPNPDALRFTNFKCIFASTVFPFTVEDIKTEIYNNGPVVAGIYAYADLLNYGSGIYFHVTGELIGGHAVKVLGWGSEHGVPYWICQNSWGPFWGEDGFVRIQMNDEATGLENFVYACEPDFNNGADMKFAAINAPRSIDIASQMLVTEQSDNTSDEI